MVPDEVVDTLDRLLSRYGLVRRGAPLPVTESVVNENFRVETSVGPRFVRFHHARITSESIDLEHRVMTWAGQRGIPIIAPLAATDGATKQTIDGRWFSIFPWVEFRQLHADAAGTAEATALGEMLGRLHETLAAFMEVAVPEGFSGQQLDTARALAELDQVQRAIMADSTLGDTTTRLLDAVAYKIGLLKATSVDHSAYGHLPRHTVHGDYHQRNVLVDKQGGIAAVIDWELVRVIPRVQELLRCITFSGLLDLPGHSAAFISGYRTHVALSAAESAIGVDLWWQLRLHGTWAYRARFIDGDLRAHQFLAGEDAMLRQFADHSARARLVDVLQAQLS
jgi:Ser/Thr protein kinase RdoA (MazF antagonist)